MLITGQAMIYVTICGKELPKSMETYAGFRIGTERRK